MQIHRCHRTWAILYCMVQAILITECARTGSDIDNCHMAVMKSKASSTAALTGCTVLHASHCSCHSLAIIGHMISSHAIQCRLWSVTQHSCMQFQPDCLCRLCQLRTLRGVKQQRKGTPACAEPSLGLTSTATGVLNGSSRFAPKR